jgi:[ribosomal protein S5]-alanine N-acetyltransferase
VIGLPQQKMGGRALRGDPRVADLETGRLRLVTITPEMLAAEQASDGAKLGRLLSARLTPEWPPADWEPHVYRFILKQYEEWPQSLGWHRYVVLEGGLGRGRTLVGAVGGFPKPDGDVEIGYSTLPEFQRRGYATAFATKLVDWLLTLEGVESVSAQTFSRLPESIKVMERCGMRFVGDGDDVGTVRYRRVR